MVFNFYSYVLVAVLAVAPTLVQSQSVSSQTTQDINRLETRIEQIESNVQKQVQNITFMIQLATSVFAIVAGAFGLWGIGTYRGLMKEVHERLEIQLRGLQKMQQELDLKLKESEQLEEKLRKIEQLENDLAPATIIARVRDALFEQQPPNKAQAASLLSQLLNMETVTTDELELAAYHAENWLYQPGLAKRLLREALKQGNGSYLISARLAKLSATDHDWNTHKETLEKLVRENPSDLALLQIAVEFCSKRGTWKELEELMGEVEARCPWLSFPSRYRALASEKLRRPTNEIVEHYERALQHCTASSDAEAYKWYADYLMNRTTPCCATDASKAESLMRTYLETRPSDGDARVTLAMLLAAKVNTQEAISQLKIGLEYTNQESNMKREGEALLKRLEIETAGVSVSSATY